MSNLATLTLAVPFLVLAAMAVCFFFMVLPRRRKRWRAATEKAKDRPRINTSLPKHSPDDPMHILGGMPDTPPRSGDTNQI